MYTLCYISTRTTVIVLRRFPVAFDKLGARIIIV